MESPFNIKNSPGRNVSDYSISNIFLSLSASDFSFFGFDAFSFCRFCIFHLN